MHLRPRRLILAALALCAAAPAVHAQPAPRPEPRVASRESIAAAPDRKIDPYAKLALDPDGSGHVLMASLGTAGKPPTLVELVSFDRAGKTTGRHTIASFGAEDFGLLGTELLRLPSGELLVATPSSDLAGMKGHGGLLRLSADGKLLHRAPIHAPHDVPADDRNPSLNFRFEKMVSTSDGNVVVGGNYGIGPSNSWWGEFTPNGTRLAEQTAKHFLTTVDALMPTPDGGFMMVFRDFSNNTTDIVLQRHSATGARQSRTLLLEKSESHQAAFTSDGRIVVVKVGEPNRMLLFAADGKLLREMPWTSPTTDWMVAQVTGDGTGFVLREESYRGHLTAQLVRLDRDGGIVWQTQQGKYIDAASRGEEIVALALEDEGKTATIVRLLNP